MASSPSGRGRKLHREADADDVAEVVQAWVSLISGLEMSRARQLTSSLTYVLFRHRGDNIFVPNIESLLEDSVLCRHGATVFPTRTRRVEGL